MKKHLMFLVPIFTVAALRKRIPASIALIALSTLAAPGVKAQCRAAARDGGTFAPELRSLQEPDALDDQDFSDPAGSPEALDQEKNDSKATILGLWKEIYFSGGVLNDVGFGHFNAGGTELINDVGALDAGNNFCIGAWKKVGPRRYDIVHPFFIFDDSGKKAIGVAIEKADIVVSRDGNRFRGKWTQDNYDLSGNIIPGFHFDGTARGTRIAPGLPFPFPFPF
jgi:hypothetical protein